MLGAVVLELGAKLTGRAPEVSRNAMVFIDRKAGYDTSAAETLLGWNPSIDLSDGMKRTEAWFRSTGLLPPLPAA